MKKITHRSERILLFVFCIASLYSAGIYAQVAASHHQTNVAHKSVDAGTLAEIAWQKGESEWKNTMMMKLKTDMASVEQFIAFNISAYSKDRGDFLINYRKGFITAATAPLFFKNMDLKYADLWKMEGNSYNKVNGTITPPPRVQNVCNPSCFNINFQSKNLSGWYGYWAVEQSVGSYSNKTGGACGSVTQSGGPDPNTGNTYHVTLLTAPGSDKVVGSFIPFTPPLGGLSVRIGDYDNNGNGTGILEQTYMVDASSPILTVQYAVVMENPGHSPTDQPWFKMEVLDASNNPIGGPNGCGQYTVTSAANLPNFKSFNGGQVYARPWTTAFVPLYGYIGQCITVRWTAGDCALGGHYGYAYVAATCAKLDLIPSSKVFCLNQVADTITGPPGAAAYTWSTNGGCIPGSKTNQSVVVTCGGTYTLVTQSSAGAQCLDTFKIVIPAVTQGPPPTPCFTATRVCAGMPTNFNASCTATPPGTKYYWDFYGSGAYNDSTSGANPVWTYSVGGTYSVRLHLVTPAGCEADKIVSVIADAPNVNTLPTWTTTVTNASVCGACNGKFDITFIKGSTFMDTIRTTFDTSQVLLSPAGLGDTVKGSSKLINVLPGAGYNSLKLTYGNLCAGTYRIFVIPSKATPPSNCTPGGFYGDTITFAITSAGVIVNANVTTTNASCGNNNGTATLTGTGGTVPYTFTWVTPPLPSGPTQTGLSPGTYTITLKDANGCQGNKTVYIYSLGQLSAQAIPFDVSCYGAHDGSISVTPTAGTRPFSYVWTPNVSTDSSASGLAPGTYSLTITDAGGCTGTVTNVIKQPTQVIATIIDSVTIVNCNQKGSATVGVTGGYGPYTYKWSPSGDITPIVTGLALGTHVVTSLRLERR